MTKRCDARRRRAISGFTTTKLGSNFAAITIGLRAARADPTQSGADSE